MNEIKLIPVYRTLVLLYKKLFCYVSLNGTEGAEGLLMTFRANCLNETYVEQVEKEVAKWARIAKGAPSPTFSMTDSKGVKVSLEDLKGTYVYIDIWASWCRPCRNEIPYLKKLQENFRGKKISFIGISVDKNKSAWKKMLAQKEMTGIQLIVDDVDTSDFIKSFMIRGVPQFVLLDPKGNIVSTNAPRPSDERLIELFDQCDM